MAFPHGYVSIDIDLIAIRGEPIQDCVRYAATAQRRKSSSIRRGILPSLAISWS